MRSRRTTILVLAALLVAAAVLFGAQATGTLEIPLWNGRSYTWANLGPTLAVGPDGALNAIIPPAPAIPARHWDVQLTAAADGTYPLPAGASNVTVWRNGLRQHASIDYAVSSNAIAPAYPWTAATDLVIADYDQ